MTFSLHIFGTLVFVSIFLSFQRFYGNKIVITKMRRLSLGSPKDIKEVSYFEDVPVPETPSEGAIVKVLILSILFTEFK